MKKVFICSPYSGDIERNTKIARKIGRQAALCDYVPIIPYLVFPQFLDDNNPKERILGITLSIELLNICDMMWIVGCKITKGMMYEVQKAKKLERSICCYDIDGNRIYPGAFSIDDRIDYDFMSALKGANLV